MILRNTQYTWHAGYRYYRSGTNTKTGVTSLIGDSLDFGFIFEGAATLSLSLSLMLLNLF